MPEILTKLKKFFRGKKQEKKLQTEEPKQEQETEVQPEEPQPEQKTQE